MPVRNPLGQVGSKPLLPITLQYRRQEFETTGLLDSGADVNVLPYQIGVALGSVWDEQNISLPLTGNLANVEARGIVIKATVAEIWQREFAFAWALSRNVRLILGQINFFASFDVCLYRTNMNFELDPTSPYLG